MSFYEREVRFSAIAPALLYHPTSMSASARLLIAMDGMYAEQRRMRLPVLASAKIASLFKACFASLLNEKILLASKWFDQKLVKLAIGSFKFAIKFVGVLHLEEYYAKN